MVVVIFALSVTVYEIFAVELCETLTYLTFKKMGQDQMNTSFDGLFMTYRMVKK